MKLKISDNFISDKKNLNLIIITYGISSICTQFIILREFINVFEGNELIISIFISNWLLLTGIGSYLGRIWNKLKNASTILFILLIVTLVIPYLQILLVRLSYKTILSPGEAAGLLTTFIYSFVILSIYCIIHGSLFPLYCQLNSKLENNKGSVGKLYFFDNLGDITGGLLYSFIFVFIFTNFQSLFIPTLFCIMVIFLFLLKDKRRIYIALVFIILLFFLFIGLKLLAKFDAFTLKFLYPDQNIIEYKETKYGRLVLTETNGQYNFYENNIFLFSTYQPIENEEVVHFSASQCTQLKSVLLISGGVSGSINELLKYNPDFIDYLELDYNIIHLANKYSLFKKHSKVNIQHFDGRLFLKNTDKKYDLIIVDLPDPLSIQLNRFYTIEFFELIKKRLSKEGIFSFSLLSNENYLNEYQINNNSSLKLMLKKYFKNVLIIPGNIHFFIASDEKLSYDIDKLITQKNISTEYVNKYYLASRLSEFKIDFLKKSIKSEAQINHDFKPYIFFNSIKNWVLEFGGINKFFIILLTCIFVFILFLQSRVSFILLTTGFSQAVIQILILFGFQIIIGYLYYTLGILITFFMIGLAIGSYLANWMKYDSRKLLIIAEFYILFIIVFFLFYILKIQIINSELLINLSFFIISLLISIPVGFQFPICAKLEEGSDTIIGAKLYSFDLLGAYFGTLLTGILLIPVFGFIKVIIIIFIIKIISFIISLTITQK